MTKAKEQTRESFCCVLRQAKDYQLLVKHDVVCFGEAAWAFVRWLAALAGCLIECWPGLGGCVRASGSADD